MQEKILQLKKLNAAYIAALEYDYCPSEDEADNVAELFETGFTNEELKEILSEHKGRRPDVIAGEMSTIIKDLQPCTPNRFNGTEREGMYAIPTEASEDELWYKAIDLIMTAHDRGLSKEEAVGVVESPFTISKRDQL